MIFGSVIVLCDKGTSDVPASVILQSKVKKKNSKITKKQKKKEKEGNKMNMYNNRLGKCLLFGFGSSPPLSSLVSASPSSLSN